MPGRVKAFFGFKVLLSLLIVVFLYSIYYVQTGNVGSPLIGQIDYPIYQVLGGVPLIGVALWGIMALITLVLDWFVVYLLVKVFGHFFIR